MFCWQTEKIISVHKIYNLSIKKEVAKWSVETNQKRLSLGNFIFFSTIPGMVFASSSESYLRITKMEVKLPTNS